MGSRGGHWGRVLIWGFAGWCGTGRFHCGVVLLLSFCLILNNAEEMD